VAVNLKKDHVRLGKKNAPSACAIALAIRDEKDKFPGELIAALVRKSFTLVATRINNKLQARRYAHAEPVRMAINGFDAGSERTLHAGDHIELLAPAGARKLGGSNGRSNAGNIVPDKPRKNTLCLRRGVYVDRWHAQNAAEKIGKKSIVE